MISAIILAAGESRRMGVKNKLLLPISGEVLISNFVKSVCASNVDEVVVVVGQSFFMYLIKKKLNFPGLRKPRKVK
jgi:CTP:molybdopterin cytidylyltransferase MocA